ncbi:MAG: LCP family protein, partial [Bacillota bacterium]|nr:LCP family protein [Bacillota bacterium]
LVNKKNPKINSSMHGGIENLQEVVSDLLGIPLDFYVEIDLNGFVELVDAVGGVDFDVPIEMYYNDPSQDLNIFYQPGMQHLTGQQAMEVCRFRHNADGTGYPHPDNHRRETTRNMMITVAKKVLALNNIVKITNYFDILQRNVETDLTASNITWFIGQFLNVDLDTGVTGSGLPGDGSVTYKGTRWCYELYPQESLDVINATVNPYTTPLTLDDLNIFQAP